MTNTDTLRWIKLNLGPIIRQSIEAAKAKNPDLLYTEDWLAGIAMRETGTELIPKRLAQAANIQSGNQLSVIAPLIKGDYSQRPGEKEKTYHGFGFWQIDIASYPDFVRSGDWKSPALTCQKAIQVLEGKRMWLLQHVPDFKSYPLDRAITAAYNCGEGNVAHVIAEDHDIDARTFSHDYSKNVWEFREIYKTL